MAPPQSLAPLQHMLRLLEQAARDGSAVPWVLLELVRIALRACLHFTAARGLTMRVTVHCRPRQLRAPPVLQPNAPLTPPNRPKPVSALALWHGGAPLLASLAADLEALGYRSWAVRVVTAAAFGAPADVRRVYLVAARHGDARDVLLAQVGFSTMCLCLHMRVHACRPRCCLQLSMTQRSCRRGGVQLPCFVRALKR